MRKIMLLKMLIIGIFFVQVAAQKQFTPTEEIKISGRIKSEITIKVSDLESY